MPKTGNEYQKVVIDTGPLIDALTLKLIERKPEWGPTILVKSPLHKCLKGNPSTQRNFRLLLNKIGEIIISSHVIGEIRSEKHIPSEFQAEYWQGCLDFFEAHNVTEKLITLRELNAEERTRQIMCEYGPIDAGIVAMADREKCRLLTHDERLYNWLGAFPGMEIKLVKNLLDY